MMMGLDLVPLVRVIFHIFSVKSVGGVGDSVGPVCDIGFGVFLLTGIRAMVMLFHWSCLYQEDSNPKVVDS